MIFCCCRSRWVCVQCRQTGPFLPVQVLDIRLLREKGFGFVTMDSVETAVRARADMRDAELHGVPLKINFGKVIYVRMTCLFLLVLSECVFVWIV